MHHRTFSSIPGLYWYYMPVAHPPKAIPQRYPARQNLPHMRTMALSLMKKDGWQQDRLEILFILSLLKLRALTIRKDSLKLTA